MLYLYNFLLYLLLPVIILRLWVRGFQAPAYWQRWTERFGFISPLPARPRIWIHAVSVGEVQAALPLIRHLQRYLPHYDHLITTTTPTGSQSLKDIFGESIQHYYLTYDFPFAVKRFLRRTQPSLLVLMETELWPNLLHYCHQQHIPVILANARLSAKSATKYQKIASLMYTMLGQVSQIAAQTSEDAQRFIALGALPQCVQVTGSIKFNLKLPPDLLQNAYEFRKKITKQFIWVAASTHEGEESLILQALKSLNKKWPDLLLILVPRHPERFEAVAQLCQKQGFNLIRRSQGVPLTQETEVFLADTMGELLLWYAVSDIAFVGGSLMPVGGHNVLEPAALGKPIIIGPHGFTFEEINQRLLNLGVATQVENLESLIQSVDDWLKKPIKRQLAGEHARHFIKQNQQALPRLVELIFYKLW